MFIGRRAGYSRGPYYPPGYDQRGFRRRAHGYVGNGYGYDGYRCRVATIKAREAAEAAIRSPLLEDVNLQGAKGIFGQHYCRYGLSRVNLLWWVTPSKKVVSSGCHGGGGYCDRPRK